MFGSGFIVNGEPYRLVRDEDHYVSPNKEYPFRDLNYIQYYIGENNLDMVKKILDDYDFFYMPDRDHMFNILLNNAVINKPRVSDEMIFLLLNYGFSFNIVDPKYRETPFSQVCKYQDLDFIKFAIEECDADPNIKDTNGKSSLHLAVLHIKPDCVQYFLEYGIDVDILDKQGQTPLHFACMYGSINIVKLLIEYGADIYAVDKFGRTPIDMCNQSYMGIHNTVIKRVEIYIRTLMDQQS